MSKEISNALFDILTSPNERDLNGESANVVDGLFAIARSIQHLANATEQLGFGVLGDSLPPTRMGAIELLAKEVHELGDKLIEAKG